MDVCAGCSRVLGVKGARLRRPSTWLVISSALWVVPFAAHAWGAAGHRLIAELAWDQLPVKTRGSVQAVLDLEPGATLVSISTWADEVRSPRTGRWHYVNFDPQAGCRYSPERDCPDGQCVVVALDKQLQRLGTVSSGEERLKALKWVVHLVADVHQPLHAAPAGDKGGNQYQVRAFGRGSNLHSVWDGGIIDHWPGGLQALRAEASGTRGRASRALTPSAWAEESCRVAGAKGFYPENRRVTDDYQVQWSPKLAGRIQAASERLAQALSRAFP